MDSQSHKRTILAGWVVLMLAGPALAVDGVIEWNQAKATAGGGFSVLIITTPGSYRLTSDITAPAGSNAINVFADDVTLDLNGFSVIGGGGGIADGISLAGQKNVEIRNGTVRGFSRNGIFTNINSHNMRAIGVRAFSNVNGGIEFQGSGNLVDGCTANGNGSGIRAQDGSLVINSVARGNTSTGLSLGATSGYRSNVLTGNNGGDANAQVSGTGLQLGSNICGTDLVCP